MTRPARKPRTVTPRCLRCGAGSEWIEGGTYRHGTTDQARIVTPAEKRVVRAAMRESRAELAREGMLEWTGIESQRMMMLAKFQNPFAAERLRACAAHAATKAKAKK